MFINLGTNDRKAIQKIRVNGTDKAGYERFSAEMVDFMRNATLLYKKPDITFFLSTGPIENTTMKATQSAVLQARAAGLKATWVDLRTACMKARLHAVPPQLDQCDGCANHPGVEGHYGMFQAAKPVLASVMGW